MAKPEIKTAWRRLRQGNEERFDYTKHEVLYEEAY